MPKLRSKSRARDQIRKDFEDAIQRIKAGKPEHPQFRAKIARRKTVKLNLSTVAQEAGRARTLIGRVDCEYPDIRNRILLESGVVKGNPQSPDELIDALQVRLAEANAARAAAIEHAQEHLKLRSDAEQEANQMKAHIERLKTENQRLQTENKRLKSELTRRHANMDQMDNVLVLRPEV
jgi:hypothetical protein